MNESASISIGRAPDADIVLHEPSVSRKHLEAFRDSESTVLLVDCSSSFGSFILRNRVWERFRQTQARFDDRIRLGGWEGVVGDLLSRNRNAYAALSAPAARTSLMQRLHSVVIRASALRTPKTMD